MLQKVVYPYEYMDNWEKFDGKSLPERFLYSLKHRRHADYAHTKKLRQDFEIKNLGECHDLYVGSDTLLLADVFENFQNMSWKIWS